MLKIWRDDTREHKEMFVFVVGFLTESELTTPDSQWYVSASELALEKNIGVSGYYWRSHSIDRLLESDQKSAQKILMKGWAEAKKEVKAAAKGLCESVKELSKTYKVTIIAHSLGCRVVSEALKQMKTVYVENIVFMAAACGYGHINRVDFKRAVRGRKLNIFSRSDVVLSKLYPVADMFLKFMEGDRALGHIGGAADLGFEDHDAENVLKIKIGHLTYSKVSSKLITALLF
jgi:hypothetical protein